MAVVSEGCAALSATLQCFGTLFAIVWVGCQDMIHYWCWIMGGVGTNINSSSIWPYVCIAVGKVHELALPYQQKPKCGGSCLINRGCLWQSLMTLFINFMIQQIMQFITVSILPVIVSSLQSPEAAMSNTEELRSLKLSRTLTVHLEALRMSGTVMEMELV